MQLQVLALARAALVLGPWALGAATAAIVNFEPLAGPVDDQLMVDYVEQGYRFTFQANLNQGTINPTGFGSWGSGSLNRPLGSSQALYNAGVRLSDDHADPGFTILTRTDGAAFDLLSIDLSFLIAYPIDGTPAAAITFTGQRAGGTISTTVDLTSFGFSSFSLGELTNVTQVRWQQTEYAHQFDNLNLALSAPTTGGSVPEPGSLALAGLALAGLLGARRSRA